MQVGLKLVSLTHSEANLCNKSPPSLLLANNELSIFTDIEVTVSHVSDVVCDLDIGPVIDDDQDAEQEGWIARFLAA